jgi:hypothetical protein
VRLGSQIECARHSYTSLPDFEKTLRKDFTQEEIIKLAAIDRRPFACSARVSNGPIGAELVRLRGVALQA